MTDRAAIAAALRVIADAVETDPAPVTHPAPEPSPRPALLRRRDVAVACSVSVRQVDAWRVKGCPVVRVGTEPRFELDAVLRWLRAGGAS